MTRIRIFFHHLLGLIPQRKLERELEEEIRSHQRITTDLTHRARQSDMPLTDLARDMRIKSRV